MTTAAELVRDLLSGLNNAAPVWANVMVRACWQGGLLFSCVWLACRHVRMTPRARAWLWWLVALKLVVGLCCFATLALPILPQQIVDAAPRLRLRHIGIGAVQGGTPPGAPPARPSSSAAAVGGARLAADAAFAGSDAGDRFGAAAKVPAAAASKRGSNGAAPGTPATISAPFWPGLLFCAWLLGVAFVAATAARGYQRLTNRVLSASSRAATASAALEAEARALAACVGLGRAPRVLVLPGLTSPLVVGLFRPVVVVPAGFEAVLTPQERRLVLAHELAHLRSADLWFGLVPALARALFWFFPPAWLLAREYVTAREEAADLLALRATGAPAACYGRLLLKMTTGPAAPVLASAGLFAPGFVALRRRLGTIREAPLPARARRRASALAAVAVLLVISGLPPWRMIAARRDGAPPPLPSPPRPSASDADRAGAAAAYDVTDVGTLGGRFSDAYAINEAGQVVGVANPKRLWQRGRAFLWQNGRMTDLGVLGRYRRSAAVGINDGGAIIGASYTRYDYHHAFVWQGNAKRALPPTLLPGYRYVRALGINDNGEVVGCAQTGARDAGGALVARAFLWSAGRPLDLGTLGGQYSHALAINDRGQVVGKAQIARPAGRRRGADRGATHAFLWGPSPGRDAIMRDLGVLPGGVHSVAQAVNEAGWAAGMSESANGPRAVLWTPGDGDRPRDLGTLPGGGKSAARGINAAGLIVGSAENAAGAQRAVLWTPEGRIVDLNRRLPAGSGWRLEEARAINDRGQIVGRGVVNGVHHAFVLTPSEAAAVRVAAAAPPPARFDNARPL